MSIKINLFFIVFLLNYFSLSAQDIAIPYRDGNLWGMCNPEGKIIIEPKFDKLEFQQDYSANHEILIPKIKDKRGLISNGKVLFDAIYENVYEKNGNYVLISEDNNTKRTDIVTPEGKSILKKPIIQIISSDNINGSITAFHILNTDYTESIFIYDNINKSIAQWLYEDYHSITILDKQSNMTSVVFAVKKSENDALITEAWDFSKLPKEKVKCKILYKSENAYLERFMEKSYKYNDEYGSGSGSYGGDEVVVMEDIKGDYSYDVVAEAPREEDASRNYKPLTYYSNSFKIVNNQLVFETSNQYNPKEKKTTTTVDLKIPVTSLEIKSYYNNVKKNDTIQYFQNFVAYKKKGKQGILFTSDVKKAIEFDTICKTFVTINNYSDSAEIVFIVGKKEKKNNRYKYSFYSNNKGLLFPFLYDDLTALKLYSNQGNITYQSRIDKKYGIVQMNGQELLKPEYEAFKQPKYSSTSAVTKLYHLKKDNKYGMIFQNTNTYKIEIIDAVFDYEIDDIYLNYPKLEYRKTTESNPKALPKITLISLKDKNGNLKGYANANGTLYYKN